MTDSDSMTQPPRNKRWRRRLAWGLGVTLSALVLWLVLSYAAAYRLTRRFGPPVAEPVPVIAWGKIAPLRLGTSDGQQLGGWFVDGRPDRLPVLLLHGNKACRSDCLREAELLADLGHPVLMISFRAHGDSTGDTNDFGYSARRDMSAAVDWLSEKKPGSQVVIWGRSLGSAAALFASAELGDRVCGYILECPYRNLRTAVRSRTRKYLPPVLDQVAFAGLMVVAPAVLPDVDAISPLSAAGHMPRSDHVLVLAGGADSRATPAEAEAISVVLGERAECVVVAGADHLRLADADPVAYRQVIGGFLDRYGKQDR